MIVLTAVILTYKLAPASHATLDACAIGRCRRLWHRLCGNRLSSVRTAEAGDFVWASRRSVRARRRDSRRSNVEQALLDPPGGDLGTRVQLQLAQDVLDMIVNRAFRNNQVLCDLARTIATSEQRCDFSLAWGDRLDLLPAGFGDRRWKPVLRHHIIHQFRRAAMSLRPGFGKQSIAELAMRGLQRSLAPRGIVGLPAH